MDKSMNAMIAITSLTDLQEFYPELKKECEHMISLIREVADVA